MPEPFAPIAIFAYKRPAHTGKLIDSLEANPLFAESRVHVYCDGPKDDGNGAAVEAVRNLVRQRLGRRASIIEAPANRGLAASIIAGVSELTAEYGRAIVLEDDLILSPGFLAYMNAALDRYANEECVYQVSGYRYPVPPAAHPQFFRLTSSWGWGTWRRAWQVFEPDAAKLNRNLRERSLKRAFDIDGTHVFNRMLEMQIAGKIDSWAIRWYASVFLSGGLSLYPSVSQVINAGFDNSGTHCADGDDYLVSIGVSSMDWPSEICEDTEHLRQVKKFFASTKPTLANRVVNRLRRGLRQ